MIDLILVVLQVAVLSFAFGACLVTHTMLRKQREHVKAAKGKLENTSKHLQETISSIGHIKPAFVKKVKVKRLTQ